MTTRKSEGSNKNQELEETDYMNAEQESSVVDVRIEHLTEWADEFFSGSAF
jgi:hypothetical protein